MHAPPLFSFSRVARFKGLEGGLLSGAVRARDRWILSKLHETTVEVTRCLESFEFGKAVQTLDTFFRGRLCDVYLELIKPSVYATEATPEANAARDKSRCVLWTCLDVGLRLLHPICPFVTEELWQRLPGRGSGVLAGEKTSIMVSAWPHAIGAWADPAADAAMDVVLGAIEGARSLRADHGLVKRPAAFFVACSTPEAFAAVQAQADDFSNLAAASSVSVVGEGGVDKSASIAVKLVSDSVQVFVDVASAAAAPKGGSGKAAAGGGGGAAAAVLVDTSAQKAKLAKEMGKLEPLIASLRKKLDNPAYLAQVPEKAQTKDREKLEQYSKMHADAAAALAALE